MKANVVSQHYGFYIICYVSVIPYQYCCRICAYACDHASLDVRKTQDKT